MQLFQAGPASRPVAGADDRTVRIVARQVSELMLARGARWQAATGTDRLDCLLFQVVFSANLAHVPLGASLQGGPPPRRPVSLLAISQSMHLAYETVRRRTTQLRAQGLVEADAGGISVPVEAVATAVFEEVAACDAKALAGALRALDASGYPAASAALEAGVEDIAPRVQARALLDFAVRVMERFIPLYGSMIAGTICVAIVAANVRHLVADPDADTGQLPADGDRRPVPLRVLARQLALPWETVRRQVAGLTASGMVEIVDGGAIVPGRVIGTDEYQQYNRHILAQFERMLAGLARV